jgi:hypothetical protein
MEFEKLINEISDDLNSKFSKNIFPRDLNLNFAVACSSNLGTYYQKFIRSLVEELKTSTFQYSRITIDQKKWEFNQRNLSINSSNPFDKRRKNTLVELVLHSNGLNHNSGRYTKQRVVLNFVEMKYSTLETRNNDLLVNSLYFDIETYPKGSVVTTDGLKSYIDDILACFQEKKLFIMANLDQ